MFHNAFSTAPGLIKLIKNHLIATYNKVRKEKPLSSTSPIQKGLK